jgi:hypothetical protein
VCARECVFVCLFIERKINDKIEIEDYNYF